MNFDRIAVFPRQFFAGTYLTAAEEEQVVANAPPLQIGIARVVDEFRAASTRAAVQVPSGIQARNVHVSCSGYVPGLLVSKAFASVFDDAAASRNVLKREHSKPMKQRRG
jgi:phage tail tube protein FII